VRDFPGTYQGILIKSDPVSGSGQAHPVLGSGIVSMGESARNVALNEEAGLQLVSQKTLIDLKSFKHQRMNGLVEVWEAWWVPSTEGRAPFQNG
jgi:hypothetical protein